MKLKELAISRGSKIRKSTWEEGSYLFVTDTQAYNGSEWGFSPEFYSPEGMLYHSKGKCPFWIYPNEDEDWIIVSNET